MHISAPLRHITPWYKLQHPPPPSGPPPRALVPIEGEGGLAEADNPQCTQRYLPISAVHCTFTAAVIHLLDIVHTEGRARAKAKQRFDVCIRSMEEMRKTWGWSGRCLRSLQSLVKEWNVDMADEYSEEPANSVNLAPAPAVVSTVVTEPQRPSPLSEHSSDSWLGGGGSDRSLENTKFRFQETVWGPEFLSAPGTGVLLEGWAVEVPGSDQFDASFVDQWWEDAAM